jgi:hypothetical protein
MLVIRLGPVKIGPANIRIQPAVDIEVAVEHNVKCHVTGDAPFWQRHILIGDTSVRGNVRQVSVRRHRFSFPFQEGRKSDSDEDMVFDGP